MAVSRDERRNARRQAVVEVMGEADAEVALDLLELLELAWHDCYGEITPGSDVIDDVLTVCDGRLDGLVAAARLAVIDRRDLRLAAEGRRSRPH